MKKIILLLFTLFSMHYASSQVTVSLSNFKVNNQNITSNTINFLGNQSITLEFDVKLTTLNGNTNNIFGNLFAYITSSNYVNPYQVSFQSIVFTPNYPPFVPEANFTSEIISYTIVLNANNFPSNTGTFYLEYKNNNSSSYKSLIYNIINNTGSNPGPNPDPYPEPITVNVPLNGVPILTKNKEFGLISDGNSYNVEYSWVMGEDLDNYEIFQDNSPLRNAPSVYLNRLQKFFYPGNTVPYLTEISKYQRFNIEYWQPFRFKYYNSTNAYTYKNITVSNHITTSSQYIFPFNNIGGYPIPQTLIGDQARVRRVKIQDNVPEEYDVSDYQWQKRIIRPLPTFEEYPAFIENYGWKDIPNATGPNYTPRISGRFSDPIEVTEYRRLVIDKAAFDKFGTRNAAASNVTRVYPISVNSSIANDICCDQDVYKNTNSSLIIGSAPTNISNYTYQWQLGTSRNNEIIWNDIEGANQKDYMPYNVSGMRNSQSYFYRRFLISSTYKYYLSNIVRVTYYPYDITARTINSIETENIEESVIIFPNPTSSSVTIEGENDLSSFNVKIVDATGKIILSKEPTLVENKSLKIDLTTIPTGIYTLILENNSNTITRKVIKN